MQPRIRTSRRIEGIVSLSRELRVDRGTIYRVLHGKRRPSPELRAALEERGLRIPVCKLPRGI